MFRSAVTWACWLVFDEPVGGGWCLSDHGVLARMKTKHGMRAKIVNTPVGYRSYVLLPLFNKLAPSGGVLLHCFGWWVKSQPYRRWVKSHILLHCFGCWVDRALRLYTLQSLTFGFGGGFNHFPLLRISGF